MHIITFGNKLQNRLSRSGQKTVINRTERIKQYKNQKQQQANNKTGNFLGDSMDSTAYSGSSRRSSTNQLGSRRVSLSDVLYMALSQDAAHDPSQCGECMSPLEE